MGQVGTSGKKGEDYVFSVSIAKSCYIGDLEQSIVSELCTDSLKYLKIVIVSEKIHCSYLPHQSNLTHLPVSYNVHSFTRNYNGQNKVRNIFFNFFYDVFDPWTRKG